MHLEDKPPLQFRVMALLLQLYLISMANYICFIFKSWSTSCYGAGKGWFILASLEHVPTARPCWAPVLSTQSVPGRFISHLSSRQTGCSRFKTVSIVCTWLPCAEARRAVALGVSWTLTAESSALTHTLSLMMVSVKKKNTQCFYYTCNFPVLYLERKLF